MHGRTSQVRKAICVNFDESVDPTWTKTRTPIPAPVTSSLPDKVVMKELALLEAQTKDNQSQKPQDPPDMVQKQECKGNKSSNVIDCI